MNDLLESDAFTRTRMDTFTGEPKRQWLEYADGVMEPVRKEGSLGRKFHGNERSLDWWTVDKPLDRDPAEEGKTVSLNHDYGRPGGTASKQTNVPTNRPAPAGNQPAPRTLLAMGGRAAKESGAAKVAGGEGPSPARQPGDKPEAFGNPQSVSRDSGSSSGKEAAAPAGALGGMVQSNGQHGKGKLVSQDPAVRKLLEEHGGDRSGFKAAAKHELDTLSKQAKEAQTPKERQNLLRRKDAIKGAIKLMDRFFMKVPLITPFNEDQLRKLIRGYDPESPVT
ncbi:hypothetical protein DND132_2178 [Pseudodesulfovibrio mercurii]|uniref:Uncharacterized protein n=1 Tax=Pseudodesulfovibrio mercurii TaxID=641491 RepID=F0JI72_9BACT|nr:hypothetical protein [Pseudodesulfovibrio mercurii]EGB15383.1 hypothetical protein DND132_2178 [Pseudodesulfovibrio mercurii]